MTPFCEGESVSSPSESRQWRRDRGSEIKPSASAGACYTALRKLSSPKASQCLVSIAKHLESWPAGDAKRRPLAMTLRIEC